MGLGLALGSPVAVVAPARAWGRRAGPRGPPAPLALGTAPPVAWGVARRGFGGCSPRGGPGAFTFLPSPAAPRREAGAERSCLLPGGHEPRPALSVSSSPAPSWGVLRTQPVLRPAPRRLGCLFRARAGSGRGSAVAPARGGARVGAGVTFGPIPSKG